MSAVEMGRMVFTQKAWEQVWREHMAAISEGFCPRHRTQLAMNGRCDGCGHWWFIREDEVVESFAGPYGY